METNRQKWARIRKEQQKHKHDDHAIEVRAGKAHNAGELYCTECQKHIQWLSRHDYEFLTQETT